MKHDTISLNKEVSIDIEKLIAGRLAILANSGGGKSWAIRRIAEQAAGKIQTIIIDPEGEFASLREKHDFILCGKGQDVPVEIRSAAMLATMLLTARASAVVDLYELHPKDRNTFINVFFQALVNAPKELHHPCIIILDEAHDAAPEGRPSEATTAVESLASKGRKRGYALIPVSQRISKLSKDVLSECSNVMIGKATWAIDRKRAAEELGLIDKQEILDLKKLRPGEFYAIGPAISEDMIRIQVGDVKTTHGKTGISDYTPVPPSASLRKALSKLAELPAEVEKEAKTSAELKEQLRAARGQIRELENARGSVVDADFEVEVEARLVPHITAMESEREATKLLIESWQNYVAGIENYLGVVIPGQIKDYLNKVTRPGIKPAGVWVNPKPRKLVPHTPHESKVNGPRLDMIVHDEAVTSEDTVPSGPEQRILNAIAWFESIGIDKPEQPAVAFMSAYTYNSSSFNNPRGAMRRKGWVEIDGRSLVLTREGRSLAKLPDVTPTTVELHKKVMSVLPSPEQRLLEPLLYVHPGNLSNEELAGLSGYTPNSSSFNNPRGRLRTLGLIEFQNGKLRARDILFPERRP